MAAPVMTYEQFQRYAAQQQAPQPRNVPMPPAAPVTQSAPAYQPQQLPYDPNASPTESWALEPMPSNVTTPMDPYKGLPLDQIPTQLGWRRIPPPQGY